MSSILDYGGTIEASGDIFAMVDLAGSKALSRKYRRKHIKFHKIIYKISKSEMEKSMEDEIEATIITEYGIEFYQKWIKEDGSKSMAIKLTVSFDFGWQRAASRRLY